MFAADLISRTSTIWRDVNPFFGEDFYLDLAQDFQEVGVYVYDQDKLKSDDPIGKVSFSRKQVEAMAQGADLNECGDCEGVDTWHALTQITKETEVTGEVLVRLVLSESPTGLDHLTVSVVCARDLRVIRPLKS